MLEQNQINKIKDATEEFFGKMTISPSSMNVSSSSFKSDPKDGHDVAEEDRDAVDLDIRFDEPQILIGQGGQTLFEIQRLLKMILNKKLQKVFYLSLDINGYKKEKVEYLKELAKESADQVSLTKEEKMLPPMSSYERRIIHSELSKRTDVVTESQGEGPERRIVIRTR